MFTLSDGFTESLDKILEKFRAESMDGTKHVRIFSYAVGPHPLPVTALKEMACGTQGSHTMITSMGAIRTSIQVKIVDLLNNRNLNKFCTEIMKNMAQNLFSGILC